MAEAKWILKPLIHKGGFTRGVIPADEIEGFQVKTCPFCGGKPYVQFDIRFPWTTLIDEDGEEYETKESTQAFEIFCSNEDCIMFNQDSNYYTNITELLSAWNARPAES